MKEEMSRRFGHSRRFLQYFKRHRGVGMRLGKKWDALFRKRGHGKWREFCEERGRRVSWKRENWKRSKNTSRFLKYLTAKGTLAIGMTRCAVAGVVIWETSRGFAVNEGGLLGRLKEGKRRRRRRKTGKRCKYSILWKNRWWWLG